MIAHSVAEHLRLIDRTVAAVTQSTEALVRASNEESLLEEICQIAVEVGGYGLAWIGYPRHDAGKTVEIKAQAGVAIDYLKNIHNLTWADAELGRGPTGVALRTGGTQVLRDIETATNFGPWREEAARFGLRSNIALPLSHGEERLGVLTIYAQEPDAFDSDVIRLLDDMASNLAYGIGALRMKAEHDHAVRELAESEERYRSLIELSPDAVVVHGRGTILFANLASAGIFGALNPALLVGRNVLDLLHPDFHPAATKRIAAPPSESALVEYRLLRLDGTPFDAEIVAANISFHGQPARLLVLRDVTERKQVQEQLMQATKLATLGEMAAGLVHELSQPLNIIRLTAEGALLFIERGKASPQWVAEQFQLVADQAERTAEIIDDIRIFSRRDNSPLQVFDAITTVRAAIGVPGSQMRPDDIALITELPDRAVPVRGRRVQLEQVVMNLLSNAHHALKEKRERQDAEAAGGWPSGGWPSGGSHGVVRVSAGVIGRELRIVVQDNGPGIPPEVRARIFEPFFTTKEAGRGTGLGLSVSFGIITAMGGRLEALDSTSGACFAITLPIDPSAADLIEDRSTPTPLHSFAEAHIMVVDDEQAAGEALGRTLRELGYRVSVCTSGSEAWRQFQADPADVVITDLRMPAGGGEQLVEQLRDFDPLLPIVIVTGHLGATERLSDNLQDDRCAVMKKPVALGKLGTIIASFLRPPE